VTRIVVLGGGFAGLEAIRGLESTLGELWKLVGFRKQLQVALDWWLARHFPRDSAIMRRPEHCPICRCTGTTAEREAA